MALFAAPFAAQTASLVTVPKFAPDTQRLAGSVVFSGERNTHAELMAIEGLNTGMYGAQRQRFG